MVAICLPVVSRCKRRGPEPSELKHLWKHCPPRGFASVFHQSKPPGYVSRSVRAETHKRKGCGIRRLTLLLLPGQFVKHLPLCLSDMANIIHVPSVSAKISQADSLLCGLQGLSLIINITLGWFTCLSMDISREALKIFNIDTNSWLKLLSLLVSTFSVASLHVMRVSHLWIIPKSLELTTRPWETVRVKRLKEKRLEPRCNLSY